ncbi:MAG: hypothetical protein OQK82_03435, partial [Candidatus Pacearchaeota archaeon]|nr:hypothetical protein [Candidatus Pacearchaeota archaeon]
TITTSVKLSRLGLSYLSVDHCLGKLRYKGGLVKIINCPPDQDGLSKPKIKLPRANPLPGLVNAN